VVNANATISQKPIAEIFAFMMPPSIQFARDSS